MSMGKIFLMSWLEILKSNLFIAIVIVGENSLGRHRIVDLDQKTGAADARHQWIAHFAGDLAWPKVAIGERRYAEIGEDVIERRSTETAPVRREGSVRHHDTK